MSDDLNRFLDDIQTHQAATEKMHQRDPGGRFELAPVWCAHKHGKIARTFAWWKPSAAEWERRSIEFHAEQAEEAKQFAEETEERIRREKSSAAGSEVNSTESVSKNAPRNRQAGKSSSTSNNGGFDFDVVVV